MCGLLKERITLQGLSELGEVESLLEGRQSLLGDMFGITINRGETLSDSKGNVFRRVTYSCRITPVYSNHIFVTVTGRFLHDPVIEVTENEVLRKSLCGVI